MKVENVTRYIEGIDININKYNKQLEEKRKLLDTYQTKINNLNKDYKILKRKLKETAILSIFSSIVNNMFIIFSLLVLSFFTASQFSFLLITYLLDLILLTSFSIIKYKNLMNETKCCYQMDDFYKIAGNIKKEMILNRSKILKYEKEFKSLNEIVDMLHSLCKRLTIEKEMFMHYVEKKDIESPKLEGNLNKIKVKRKSK